MSASAYTRVLRFLTERRFAISPLIADKCGVRNVPDTIKRLRADGHIIQTFFTRAKYRGHQYPRIAEYAYWGYNSAKAAKQPISRQHAPRKKVMGKNLAKLNLAKKAKQ